MTEFAGWEMPLSYTSIIEEHKAVRTSSGLFDIGHMGLLKIGGEDALSVIQALTTNDASHLEINQAQYSIICNEKGGVIDDVLVYRLQDHYMIVTNATNFEIIYDWFLKHGIKNCRIEPLKSSLTMLSLQGPKSELILSKLCDINLGSLKHHRCTRGKIGKIEGLVSRTGYTGEDGFELFISPSSASELWKLILETGRPYKILPCGLGARDTLRLEAGLPLYEHEYTVEITPLEAGYSWAVKFDKGNFVGRDVLLRLKEKGIQRKLIGINVLGRSIPRANDEVFADSNLSEKIGYITSGTFSPTLGLPIGMAYIEIQNANEGRGVYIKIRGKSISGKIVSIPFYKRKGGKL